MDNSKSIEFEEYFKGLLECPICLESIKSATIQQCTNGHVVCKDCNTKVESCPICRNDSTIARSLMFEDIIRNFSALSKGDGGSELKKYILKCSVCIASFKSTPILQCTNNHLVCKDCDTKLENCPICRNDSPIFRNLILEQITENFSAFANLQMRNVLKSLNIKNGVHLCQIMDLKRNPVSN